MASIALTAGLAAAGGVASSVIGSNAATSAANTQANAQEQGIAEQQREFNTEQQNAAPFVQAGQTSIGQLMTDLGNGTFGPGSIPQFTAPTLAQAEQTPGYQFTQQQGQKGIEEAAAAAGGAVSGGTLKAAANFNQGLASTYYQQAFNNALSQYGAQLSRQSQAFGQLLAPIQIGSGSTANLNSTQAGTSSSIAQLMGQIGASQAAGTVGSANAITGGLGTATNGITQALLLGKLLGGTNGTSTPVTGNIPLDATNYTATGINNAYLNPAG